MARRQSVIDSDDIELKTPPELPPSFEPGDIEVVDALHMRSQAEEAKFMEEHVVLEVEGDDDPNSPVFVYFGHNGTPQWVQRGTEQRVKRKFLYSALAAKTVRWASNFGKDQSGNEFNQLNANVKTTYRVRLISDPNPQGGMKWVQQVAQSA